MNKKGASKFVNTVLLMGFIVALVIIVALWGKSYMEELAEKRGTLSKKELECQNVELSIYDFALTGPGEFVLTLENKGTEKLHKFTLKITGSKDTEVMELAGPEVVLDLSQIKNFENLYFVETDVGHVEKIEVIPWLKVAIGKYIPCTNQKVIRNL